tara:strand:- start:2020 stop:2862 length:843 start_codon:yes stop_codon:yes gene_type:complete
VNGEYTPEESAKISIFDRGFIFGDGVYEVVPVVAGKLVDRDYFLERLDKSLAEMSITWPCSQREYLDIMQELITRNGLEEGSVYSQVTRGIADRDFVFPIDTTPSLIAFTSEMNLLNNPLAESGIAVTTSEDIRWKRRDIKSINLLAQCLAKQDAHNKGANEGWMVEDGFVTEGVTSSAYIIIDNKVITRPISNFILSGIRRRTLIEIAECEGIEFEQRLFTVEEAQKADEAFISSATTIALPVVSIDGERIADGKPGKITRRLRKLYIERLLEEAKDAE